VYGQEVAALCVIACFGLLLAPVSRAGAVFAIIAVFASAYSVPVTEQHHRTLNSFLFFMLSNPYCLLRSRSH
jgi:hypothetical protein